MSWKDVAVRGEGEIQNQGEHCLVPSVAELNRPQLIFFFLFKEITLLVKFILTGLSEKEPRRW